MSASAESFPSIFHAAADIFDPPALTEFTPLPHQEPPTSPDSPNYSPVLGPQGWFVWLLMAGRGAGKTQAASYYTDKFARSIPDARIAIIAPTLGDARMACVDGPSGLLAINPTIKVRKTPDYYLLWPNGSRADIFGAHSEDDVERLRAGGNRHMVWAEELAAWRYLEDAWDQMEFGLRLGTHPHVIVSTTPKNRPFLRKLSNDPKTIVTRGSTLDNPHLHPTARERLLQRYKGTTIGRQELFGELLADERGALWTHSVIERARYVPIPHEVDPDNYPADPQHADHLPLFDTSEPLPLHVKALILDSLSPRRVVTAIDPATTANEHSDRTGIVTVAQLGTPCPIHALGMAQEPDKLPQLFDYKKASCFVVLDDATMKGMPQEWANQAIHRYEYFSADRMVGEVNNGGDLVEMTIRSQEAGRNVNFRTTRASRGKLVRAEPISALYEQGRVHHIGYLPELEEEMVTWNPSIKTKSSPDRVDALVWGLSEIAIQNPRNRRSTSISPIRVGATSKHWTVL